MPQDLFSDVKGSQISPLRSVRGQIQNGHQTTGSEDKTARVGTKQCKNTCSTNLAMPIHLVVLLIASQLKDIQLSHGQVTLCEMLVKCTSTVALQ